MAKDVPFEFPKHLLEAAERIRDVWEELRLVLPAISIESQGLTGRSEGAVALEVEHCDLGGTVKESMKVAPGAQIMMSHPAEVVEVVGPPVQTGPGEEVPMPDKQIEGTPKPPAQFEIPRRMTGDIIRVRIATGAKPGARAYVRIGNLKGADLDVLETIPDDYPSDGALPNVYASSTVGGHGYRIYDLTQPLNASERGQLILYFSAGPFAAVLHPQPHVIW
ncbi:hypothetical protein DEA8626_01123 [Defluviimonas aquaemixtae]|uniref:Uncharacterized protein n=1 Tax=Albidovulum aquaemixtae TaxID=1542388 RepID=A0A2R8B4Z0_9RHOB|nr:hypothetical protein [Defluviimonas aquaemixtae]SPH17600.1 hypothetical protein DEA8626_01123 [Defluviimonas aquaemixtae]